MNSNRCVVCGEIIPEGRQVCKGCESANSYEKGYAAGVRDFANRIRGRDRTWSISEIEKELLENNGATDSEM
jgi:hypothetical protein